jgi:hypothetical protein
MGRDIAAGPFFSLIVQHKLPGSSVMVDYGDAMAGKRG